MNPIENCSKLNCQQITISTTSLIVGVALTAIGAYLTLIVNPAIAYSLVGIGSASVLSSLVYLAVILCKSKNKEKAAPTIEDPSQKLDKPVELDKPVDQPGNPVKENEAVETPIKDKKPKVEKKHFVLRSSSEEKSKKESESDDFELSTEATDTGKNVPQREEIKLINTQLYQPGRNLLFQYCKQVGGRDEAVKLLQKKGKEAGDYTFYQKKPGGNQFVLCVLDASLNVQEVEVEDPTVYNGDIYSWVYEWLRYPILPNEPQVNLSAIHSTWVGYKNFALFKEIDGEGLPQRVTSLGIFQKFARWLEGSHKKIRFNPTVFFKIVGHSFGLLGKYEFEYKGSGTAAKRKYEINYEGFTRALGRSVIMQDILQDLKNTKYSQDVKTKIAEMCQNAYVVENNVSNNPTVAQLMEMLNKDIPITIVTGWTVGSTGHAVNITMSKNRLIFTNKGDGAGLQPGMRIFRIQGGVTQAQLAEVFKLKDQKSFPGDVGVSALEKILNLKFEKTIKSSYHKVGCCVFANSRKCYEAAALLLGVNEQTARDEFKAARQRMRLHWLNAMFTLVDKEEEDNDLKTELYFFFLLLTFKLVTKKNYLKKENSLDHYILERIGKRVKTLQKEKDHPYLKKIVDVLAGKTHYTDLPKVHSKIIEEMLTRSANFYQIKT